MAAPFRIAAIFGAALMAANPAGAAVDEDDTFVQADEITYDDELGVLVARGGVEIVRGKRVLLADAITYNERDDIVAATGQVTLLQPGGDIFFADYMELRDGLREGVIEELRILEKDNSRFASRRGTYRADDEARLYNSVYSPCELCKEDPSRAPLWQLKAGEIVHDYVDENVYYYDAWLEVFGVPVFYTPFFAHAAAGVEKRTGLLTPTVRFDEDLGVQLMLPYFINFAPNQDLTLAPIVTTKERGGLFAEYRHHFGDGRLVVEGSGTYVEKRDDLTGAPLPGNEVRGHIRGSGLFDINNNWRWGFDLDRASDRTYLRRYGFSSPTTLTTRGFFEGFNGRSYALAEALIFQGLRSTDTFGDTPIVGPFVQFSHVTQPTKSGARWAFDINLLNIIRTESADTTRISASAEWLLPLRFDNGQLLNVSASVIGQGYWADILADPTMPFGPSTYETEYRFYPQLVLDWHYPWARQGENGYQVIEPIIALQVAPPSPNDSDIPNEDSLDFEFDDANLFADNRFAGLDRFDGGTRLVYGLKASHYWNDGGYASVFFGQSYEFVGDTVFAANTGLDDDLSDLVGRIEIQPTGFTRIVGRFRFDKDDFAPRRIDVDGQVDLDPLRIVANYTFVDDIAGPSGFAAREQVYGEIRYRIDDYWEVRASHRHDLTPNVEPLETQVGIYYEDECFELAAEFERNDFDDADFTTGNSFMFRATFKTLTTIGTSL